MNELTLPGQSDDLVVRARILVATCSAYNADDEDAFTLAEALTDACDLLDLLADALEMCLKERA